MGLIFRDSSRGTGVVSSPRSNRMGTPGTRSGKDRQGHRSGTFTETNSAELAATDLSAIGRLLCHPRSSRPRVDSFVVVAYPDRHIDAVDGLLMGFLPPDRRENS